MRDNSSYGLLRLNWDSGIRTKGRSFWILASLDLIVALCVVVTIFTISSTYDTKSIY
jgi:hypothetical protein